MNSLFLCGHTRSHEQSSCDFSFLDANKTRVVLRIQLFRVLGTVKLNTAVSTKVVQKNRTRQCRKVGWERPNKFQEKLKLRTYPYCLGAFLEIYWVFPRPPFGIVAYAFTLFCTTFVETAISNFTVPSTQVMGMIETRSPKRRISRKQRMKRRI